MEKKPERIVIALGGNALQGRNSPGTAEAQLEVVRQICRRIAKISNMGYEIAIVHGNGPQVGRIVLASETAKDVTPAMPFDVCGAMSQGYIGYQIQQCLGYELSKSNRNVPVVTVATQIIVDKNDPAFRDPTKPIGPFYTEEEAKELEALNGWTVKEDAERGWRRVVPSPRPIHIVELGPINQLWDRTVVITCGGGGIPVIERSNGRLEGIAAVIDKDYAAELLAREVEADILMILTDVEKISLNYNTPEQVAIDKMNLDDVVKYSEEGQFHPGSMLPKVKAAAMFVRRNPNKKAIITSLEKAVEALDGKTGTQVTFS